MQILTILCIAIAPSLTLLTYFYLKENYSSEPILTVMKLFLFGVLLVFPTMVIQRGLVLGLGENDLLFSFIISGGIEEFLKLFILYYTIFNHHVFDSPYDGIVYGVSISLGFATLENIIYAFSYSASFFTLMLRGLLPISGHAIFGVIMGFYISKAKFLSQKKYLILALVIPVAWHGLFDYIMLAFQTNWIMILVVFMIFLWIKGLRKVKQANHNSTGFSITTDKKFEV
ncbi:glutamic-type intramembrane protease PrsW [Chengkuizengella sediminis]|uniref:glutamic-type intramembrane protease PrsW n=1 Tax=Chengkuizengella sediminis TaxID=1885917 RepID=UPI0013898054|nr:glutamic-type intramembrane protease PrsW [Chengkuizengella sediminis]NDI34328.1 intramembrane metalloprotease PrsW [Chengkuizengella sediminis]